MLQQTKSIILSREDIDHLGYDSSKISDAEFIKIGERSGEFNMEGWWISLEQICEDRDVKRIKK